MRKLLLIILTSIIMSGCTSSSNTNFAVGDCLKPNDSNQIWILRAKGGITMKGSMIFNGNAAPGSLEMNEHVTWVKVACPAGVK